MIYYSKEPINTWHRNLIMLDLEDDMGHIYITRNTYDQAVLIADRFNHNPDLVLEKLGCEASQSDAASYMVAVLPDPINILTPFYHLIDSRVQLDVEDLRQTIGVLSYISMSIDFNMMLKVPFEVRANLIFTKSILLDYQGHFEDFNFKINREERHIIPEVEKKDIPRKDKENLELEEPKEDKGIDLDTFFDDIGWNDIPIPDLTPMPTENVETTTPVVSKPANIAGSNYVQEKSEASIYEEIANKFC